MEKKDKVVKDRKKRLEKKKEKRKKIFFLPGSGVLISIGVGIIYGALGVGFGS